MLNLDPEKRLNAIKLINHSWFDGISKEEEQKFEHKYKEMKHAKKINQMLIKDDNRLSEFFDPFETPSQKQRMQPEILDFDDCDRAQSIRKKRALPSNFTNDGNVYIKKRKIVSTDDCDNKTDIKWVSSSPVF